MEARADISARGISCIQDVTTIIPVDAGLKLNVHKTFRRRPGLLLNVSCTFNLRPVSTGMGKLPRPHESMILEILKFIPQSKKTMLRPRYIFKNILKYYTTFFVLRVIASYSKFKSYTALH